MLSRFLTFLKRPVAWGAVMLSYLGIIAAVSYAAAIGASNQTAVQRESARADAVIAHETEVHTRDLCKVVINVHDNAKFRAATDRQQLRSALEYLRTGEDADLRSRVRQTISITRARVRVAEANVHATAVPPTCKPYE